MLLGTSALLRSDPSFERRELPQGVPIARAMDRDWFMTPAGQVRAAEADGGTAPPPAFSDATRFVEALARDAGEWRGFGYPVVL